MKKKQLSRRTRALLLRVIQQLQKYPETYNQNTCVSPDCGSPSCIIGWFQFFNEQRGWHERLPFYLEARLYWPNRWPGKMKVVNEGSNWDNIKPSAAIERINLFLKTDGTQ